MQQTGFTLIELLVALAIFAIISAIAVPIYTQYSIRSYEAEARADLLRCAAGMERHASIGFTYLGAVGPGANTGAVTANICVPQSTRYTFAVSDAEVGTFRVAADPIAGTAVSGQPPIWITADGRRSWD
jgi:type IV pilus assembly protein PilE